MLRRFALSSLLLVTGFSAGLVLTGRMRSASESHAETQLPAGAARRHAPARPRRRRSRRSARPTSRGLPAAGVKAVANISALQVVRTPNSPFGNDPVFRYFFGDGDEAFGTRDRRSLSLGSGVIISADGYVVTNNHVVGDNVREITVALSDKRAIKGRVIGVDPTTDIALLKIDAKGLAGVVVGRLEPAQGRRVGAGDRQPLSIEPDGHRRHRQRDRPDRPRLRRLRRLHPDRRRHQPRQLGRRAAQRAAAS